MYHSYTDVLNLVGPHVESGDTEALVDTYFAALASFSDQGDLDNFASTLTLFVVYSKLLNLEHIALDRLNLESTSIDSLAAPKVAVLFSLMAERHEAQLPVDTSQLLAIFDAYRRLPQVETAYPRILHAVAELALDDKLCVSLTPNELAALGANHEMNRYNADASFRAETLRRTPPQAQKKTIALTFSGCIRNYAHSYNLARIVQALSKEYSVFVFYYIFDRLGNIRVPKPLNEHIGASHGGLETVLAKSRLVSSPRFEACFKPTASVICSRLSDSYYNQHLGHSHPQWYMVHQACALSAKYASTNNLSFHYGARLRLDQLPHHYTGINRCLVDPRMAPGALMVMQKHSYGFYSLSDRTAIGHFADVDTYCKIGEGRNFVELEETEEWRTHIGSNFIKSHETHLALWCKRNNLAIHKSVHLDPKH